MTDQPPQPDPTPLSRGEYFLDQARREWRYRVYLLITVGAVTGLDKIALPSEVSVAAGAALLAWAGKLVIGRIL